MVSTSQSALDSMCKIESQRTGTVCVCVCFRASSKKQIQALDHTCQYTVKGLHETNPYVPLVFKVPRSQIFNGV